MDEAEGALSFDFEGGLDAAGPSNPAVSTSLIPSDSVFANSKTASAGPISVDPTGVNLAGRRSFRQTVCRHWLRGLCMKGDACGFLHQYDKSRMPICRFFRLYGECREQDCVYKHTNEDIKECNMYKLGFCPNGPTCRYRHVKLPGPPPSVEEVLQKVQHMTAFNNYGSANRFFQNANGVCSQPTERPPFSQNSSVINNEISAKAAIVESSKIPPPPPPQQQVQQSPQSQQPGCQAQLQNSANSLPNQENNTGPIPLPQGPSRYFIVKSCNRENLELSAQQGVWATQRSNEPKLNEAFDSAENVILIFSVNRTRHFQGCAKMTSKIGEVVGGGNWKYQHGTAHYGRNFSVKWLKLCELSFHKTRHLRNPYNENLPVKISRDCQELESSIGEQLASLLYLEPNSELMAISIAAESKREEEQAKGVSPDVVAENPDIVPFEDNEEEEEEESDEEEENFDLGLGAIQGRGRATIWSSAQIPWARGRPFSNVRGFPPGTMASDGFSYGPFPSDGFAMQDPFARPFAPFGPARLMQGHTFGGTSGFVFPGQPPLPGANYPGSGLGMMMGPGRGPFIGWPGMTGTTGHRANRPIGVPSFRPLAPPQLANHPARRDQWMPTNDGSDREQKKKSQDDISGRVDGMEDVKYSSQGSRPQVENSLGADSHDVRNEESESEDEAPRRSRNGEGKKKRRNFERDEASDTWVMPSSENHYR